MDFPKPKPPVKVEVQKKVVPAKKPFVPREHLTQKPFQNRGMQELKFRLKTR